MCPEVKRVIASAALDRFKQPTREITRRAKGVSMETTIADLAPYLFAHVRMLRAIKRYAREMAV